MFFLFYLFTDNFTTFGGGIAVQMPFPVSGKTVVLSGDMVKLTCNPLQTANVFWYYFNHTLGEYHIVHRGLNLTFQATVEDSGKYLCSQEPRETPSSHAINLTIVGKCVTMTTNETQTNRIEYNRIELIEWTYLCYILLFVDHDCVCVVV